MYRFVWLCKGQEVKEGGIAMTSAPCKGCELRALGCHANCDTYKSWVEARKCEVEGAKRAMPIALHAGSFMTNGPRLGPGKHKKTRRT